MIRGFSFSRGSPVLPPNVGMPCNLELVANAIARALEMPLSERQERHSHILATLSQNSSDVWGARFLQSLEQLEVPESGEEFLQRYVI